MQGWVAMFGVLIAGVAMGILIWYFSDRHRLFTQMKTEGQIVQTARGPMEYASFGDGPALLVIHGWGGGGTGGYNMFRFLAAHGYRVISASRPGYLHTPLAVGKTSEEQADAYAALLDALQLDRAAIATGSGGGPSSLLFALRHPERCWAMVLVSATTHPQGVQQVTRGQKVLRQLFKSDFFIWVVATFMWQALVEAGMGKLNDEVRRDPQKMTALKELIRGLILGSLNASGMENDFVQWEQMPIYPMEQVRVPTLIFHSRNDQTVPYAVAEFTATIPNSKLLTYEDGGHTCYIVHAETTQPATVEFLNVHRPI